MTAGALPYLIDTSILRGQGDRAVAEVANQGFNICISPYTLIELLAKLEDDFRPARASLRRIRFINVLEHPEARILQEVGLDEERIPFGEIFRSILNAIDHAESIEQ